jgi:hypothetical protein
VSRRSRKRFASRSLSGGIDGGRPFSFFLVCRFTIAVRAASAASRLTAASMYQQFNITTASTRGSRRSTGTAAVFVAASEASADGAAVA